MEVSKVKLTWEDVERQICTLALQIKQKLGDLKFDAVVSIGRGGMVPARLLAEKLDVHSAYIIGARAYTEDNELAEVAVSELHLDDGVKSVLLVDDLIFTGTTIRAVLDRLADSNPHVTCTTAFLYKSVGADVSNLDVFIGESYDGASLWLVFPWEDK